MILLDQICLSGGALLYWIMIAVGVGCAATGLIFRAVYGRRPKQPRPIIRVEECSAECCNPAQEERPRLKHYIGILDIHAEMDREHAAANKGSGK